VKFRHRLKRFYKFEYWPFWFFYSPFILQWLWYSLRSWNFVYFTRANHKTPFGAFFEYSKFSLIKPIEPKYLPKTKFYNSEEEVEQDLQNNIYNKSFIYKPDFGERGVGVTIYYNLEQWKKEFKTVVYPCLIQEYIDFPIELGVLFYKFPSGKKGVTSVVGKSFLTVIGDGKSTLKELIFNEIRAATRINFLSEKFRDKWNSIIKKNEEILLEEIGNHNRGTTFLNSNNIICEELVNIMDSITKNIEGFHFGRLDLKCNSIKELYKGENIKVIEVNGVASEAAHIYDPKMKLLNAYKAVYENNKIVYLISKELKEQGIKTPNTLFEFIKGWFKQRKRA